MLVAAEISRIFWSGATGRPFVARGPRTFVDAVALLLAELRERLPLRHEQALSCLPGATFDPERLQRENAGAAARADGIFAVDGSDYEFFRWVFLHEVGHGVRGDAAGERAANQYADQVVEELTSSSVASCR